MKVSNCPNCGGADLYRSVRSTSANGPLGPHLLPDSSPGHLRVVVCRNCGLMRLFASSLDLQSLSSREWERVVEPTGPLGLGDPSAPAR